MKVGDYYEIAKENTSQEILGAVQDTKETVQNFHAGGVPPANMKAINVAVGDGKLKLTFTEPDDTVIDSQLICTVKGCVVRMKEGSYPVDEKDGVLVVDNTEPGKYSTEALEITGLQNDTTYYLAFFPYSDQGLYNYNTANRREATPKAYILYGYKINKADSNPATRITYTEMAVGMTPAAMDFTNGKFNYGSWGDAWFITGNKPYMVKYDGTVDYELDANDYKKKANGTASDVANSSYGGNAMASFPLMWFKRWEDSQYEYCNICNIQLDETYTAYAHTRQDGTIMDVKYLAMFEGSYISSKMRSLSGQSVGVSQTAATEISYATANGSRWYTQSFSEWAMVADLLRLISRNDNSQAALGYGRGGASAAMNTGSLVAKGQFFGYSEAQSKTNAVKVFHIENFWGNVWNRIAGLMNLSGKIYTKEVPPYNTTGSGYTNTGLTPAGTSGGYINLTKMLAAGRVGYTASGSATTYAADGFWFNNSQSNYALVGGGWGSAAFCGASCLSLGDAASVTNASVGACLSCEQPAA